MALVVGGIGELGCNMGRGRGVEWTHDIQWEIWHGMAEGIAHPVGVTLQYILAGGLLHGPNPDCRIDRPAYQLPFCTWSRHAQENSSALSANRSKHSLVVFLARSQREPRNVQPSISLRARRNDLRMGPGHKRKMCGCALLRGESSSSSHSEDK
jgi:hypothetical protein